MEESSSEELSKELSNLSFTSNASSALSTSAVSENSSHNADSINPTDEYSDGISISRGSTQVSSTALSKSDSETLDVSRENSSVTTNDDSQVESGEKKEKEELVDDETVPESNENTFVHENGNEILFREDSSVSNDGMSRESSEVTNKHSLSRESTDQISRETTNVSEQDNSSEESNIISRESTLTSNGEMYENDFETSRENTMSTNNETHATDSGDSQEQSPSGEQNGRDEMEKEDSVLIERDGKFELVDKSDLEADELEMLGLSPSVKTNDDQTNIKRTGRPKSSITKKSEYAHVTSPYALTETQREMKQRRISVRQMRMTEEKQRQMEEDERQRIANEKSYRKWLSQKSASSQRQVKKEIADAAANEERRKLAEKSYNLWLKEKELKQKEERKIEKIRLADEAEHYIVRDRVMCERSFRQWLKQKKQEENGKMAVIERPRKKMAKIRQKPVSQELRTLSAVQRLKMKAGREEQKLQVPTKANKKTDKVR